MGITFADLRFTGILPVDNDKFKIYVKGETMSLAPSLMNLGDNRSKPVALLSSIYIKYWVRCSHWLH